MFEVLETNTHVLGLMYLTINPGARHKRRGGCCRW